MGSGIWCLSVTDRELLLRKFALSAGIAPSSLSPLGGDASFRRYYRAGSFIIADSPPDTQKNHEFLKIDKALANSGIRVPEIIKADLEHGFFLEEDLGDLSFARALNEKRERALYQKALSLASDLALADIEDLPPFDGDFIKTEFEIFREWYLKERLGLSLDADENALLDDTRSFFIRECLSQPQVPMHRDFHCRNIMLKGDELCLIDFQDMVKGPLCYDSASLIYDCYIKLPEDLALPLVKYAYEQARGRGLWKGSYDEYNHAFVATSLQRHVKVLGIFSRLHLRDGKDGYLKDLPRVMSYCMGEAAELGLDAFGSFLARVSELPCAR